MTTPLTLDQLLASLSPQMSKAASAGEESDEKGSSSEDKTPAFLKGKDSKEEDDKNSKKDDKKKSDDSEGQTKEAAEAGSALAREIMMKTAAALNTPIEGNSMNKQASLAGQTLAQTLLAQLTKSAAEGETNTPDGIFPEAAPNRLQRDNAEMVSEQASQTKPMVTSDGLRPTGSINQILDALIADAAGQGAASVDQVHTTGVAAAEGAVEDHAVPNQAEEVEKMAALGDLIAQGFDFDQAVNMVKVASEQLAQENEEMEKLAAVNALVSEYGVDYGSAVDMVKWASDQIEAEQFELEKTAYLKALLNEGVDFDSAVAMVKSAAEGETNTPDGIFPESVPNRLQRDVAEMVAEQSSQIKPMVTSDGLRPTGSINEIFDALIANAVGQGAASVDQVHTTGVSNVEGAVEDHAVPNQVGEVEKVAALNTFLSAGVDFDSAMDLVKQAEELAAEQFEKEASLGGLATRAKRKVAVAAGRLAKNPLVYGGAALGAAGTAGAVYAARDHEKAAAFDDLLSQGFDFDSAAALVKEASLGGIATRAKRKVAVAAGRTAEAVRHGAGVAGDFISPVTGPVSRFAGDTAYRARAAAGNAQLLGGEARRDLSSLVSGEGGRLAAAGRLAKNPLVYGGAALGTAGLAGAAYANRDQEKKAAMDMLMNGGIDFASAAAMVDAKSKELYGE